MLATHKWMRLGQDISIEYRQALEEGKDVTFLEARVKEIQSMEDSNPNKDNLADEIFELINRAPMIKGYPYEEPSDLDGIKNVKLKKPEVLDKNLCKEKLYHKVYGAWLGRVAGCLLGKPIEGWKKERLYGLLKDTGNFPISRYISSDISQEIKDRYEMKDVMYSQPVCWINNLKGTAPVDDDTNYTVLALKILENYGRNFTPDDVAESWLYHLPMLSTCTAERVAYRNIANSIYPPKSAVYKNPYREWIGAQIRGDFFGYINPGDPEKAAEFAWRDASISHTKNGIYGEMFIAAMLAAAAVSQDMEQIIEVGLSQIPEKCRLAEKVRQVVSWYKEGVACEKAIEKVHSIYNEYDGHDWCHTISNAMIVCIGLLYGEKDFEKSITIAIMGVFDTDCNGATVGSIVGMLLGADNLPDKWIAPLNDTLKTSIAGYETVKISDMARRTLSLIE